jgi:hypothetical protein
MDVCPEAGMMEAKGESARGRGWWGLALAIAAGAVLRLIWPSDIEYKADEDFSMSYALGLDGSEPFPPLGMPSSTGLPNFGFSVWAFVLLGRLFAVQTPPDLARSVAVCSIVAMLVYAAFIRRLIAAPEREAWDWGVALMAVSPLAVFLQRKIWPPALFPLLVLVFLAGWMRRSAALGAFVFGCLGALLGQLHMAGFFLAAAFAAWALLFDHGSVRWRWWFGGSVIGSLPMLPWIMRLLEGPGGISGRGGASLMEPLKGLFWIRWFAQPFGFDTLNNSLGGDFWDFLRYPLIGGQPTYLAGVLHGVLAILFVSCAIPAVWQMWQNRAEWRARFVGRQSATAFTLAAAFWGFGILFALTGRPFRYYYLLVSMPLMYVAAARAVLSLERPAHWLPPRRCLLLLCIAQGLLSLTFLNYVHTNQRIRGDYGIPYGAQQPTPVGDMSKGMRK